MGGSSSSSRRTTAWSIPPCSEIRRLRKPRHRRREWSAPVAMAPMPECRKSASPVSTFLLPNTRSSATPAASRSATGGRSIGSAAMNSWKGSIADRGIPTRRSGARTIRAIGYPSREALANWVDEFAPGRRKYRGSNPKEERFADRDEGAGRGGALNSSFCSRPCLVFETQRDHCATTRLRFHALLVFAYTLINKAHGFLDAPLSK